VYIVFSLPHYRTFFRFFRVQILGSIIPRMSGLDLAQAARQIFPNIPVILMTGCCGSEIQTRAVSAPLAGILTKPFTMSQLRDMLHQNGI
jgi:DNA-binding NtrC family response regulator